MRNPSSVRDILDACDVIDSVLHLARAGTTGSVNSGSSRGWTVRELALAVARECGRRITVDGERQ